MILPPAIRAADSGSGVHSDKLNVIPFNESSALYWMHTVPSAAFSVISSPSSNSVPNDAVMKPLVVRTGREVSIVPSRLRGVTRIMSPWMLAAPSRVAIAVLPVYVRLSDPTPGPVD
jgi:hypothetical protein